MAVLTSPKGGLKQLLAEHLSDPASCKDEGLANFVHGMRIMFDEVPDLCRNMFRKRWDEAYPRNAWDDTPASGQLMWNGSELNVALEGAWSVQDGGKRLAVQVASTGGAPAQIELLCVVSVKGTKLCQKIRVGAEEHIVTLVKRRRVKANADDTLMTFDVSLAFPYGGQEPNPSVYTQEIKYEMRVDKKMKRDFEREVTKGDCSKWENSLVLFALLNSSHALLPEAHAARELLDSIRNFRNGLCHSSSCSMEGGAVDSVVESIQRLAQDHVGPEKARELVARIAAIRAPTEHAAQLHVSDAALERWDEQAQAVRDEGEQTREHVSSVVSKEAQATRKAQQLQHGVVVEKLDGLLQKDQGKEAAELAALQQQARDALFSTIPALPTRDMPRDSELQALTRRLVPAASGAGGGGVSNSGNGQGGMAVAVIGVANRGGAGKTTEVIRAARAPAVQSEYCDGVFFLTLGESADPLAKLTELAQAVARTIISTGAPALPASFASVDDAKAQLQAALHGRRALLVLDDVWPKSHPAAAELLAVARASGRMRALLTTREKELVRKMGAEEHHLGELSAEQALAMLAQMAQRPLEQVRLDGAALRVALLCERLPVLLRPAGAMAAAPGCWRDVEDAIAERALDEFEVESGGSAGGFKTVLSVLRASIDALEPALRAQYLLLAAVAEDTWLPVPAQQALWGAGRAAAKARRALEGKSLLDCVREDGALKLHDRQVRGTLK